MTWVSHNRSQWVAAQTYWNHATSQMENLAKNLYKGANAEIAHKIIGDMHVDEMIQRLGNLNDLSSELKTQLIIAFPKTRALIDVNTLNADQRTILLCLHPIKSVMKKFDMNANDLTIRQYRYILGHSNSKVIRYLYDNINDKKLALFGIDDWEDLISYCTDALRRFDIKTIHNQSKLRYLILRRPDILQYATLEDMQNCIIDGPTWIRIITEMLVSERKHIPAGFKDWVARDIFKKKLTGRRFKKFAFNWTKGLQD